MQETIYLKIDQNTFSTNEDIRLSDVASVYCSNHLLQESAARLELTHFQKGKKQVAVISVMEIIRKITTEYPNVNVCNLGESDFIVEYARPVRNKLWSLIKVLVTCVIVFVGSAFTIMAYNNDVGIVELFDYCYHIFIHGESNGILEISYSIGLLVGIVIFYNHFAGKKLSDTPTPVEVQMRSYEQDINTAIIERASRTNVEIDGGQ